jgi:LPPG:FO 2-phospho-L-lactate transferase
MIRAGRSLTEVTKEIAGRMKVAAKILPATDDEVTTMVSTGNGEMHLQEFWVKNRGRPQVTGVRYAGIERAQANRYAVDAIRDADMVIIAPANPISSIGPTVALLDIRRELVRARDRVIAVSPIVGKSPVSGPAAKYMRAAGLKVSPAGVAEFYSDFAGSFVVARGDRRAAGEIGKIGIDVSEAEIVMRSRRDEARLARHLLERTG